jgi:SRSO17 transposase
MAAIIAPARVAAEHLSLLHLVGQAAWSDAAVLGTVRDLVRPAIERQAAIAAWIVDDTGFAKKIAVALARTLKRCPCCHAIKRHRWETS